MNEPGNAAWFEKEQTDTLFHNRCMVVQSIRGEPSETITAWQPMEIAG